MPIVRQRRAVPHCRTALQHLDGPQCDIMKSLAPVKFNCPVPIPLFFHGPVESNSLSTFPQSKFAAFRSSFPVIPGFRYLRRFESGVSRSAVVVLALSAAFCVGFSADAHAKSRRSSKSYRQSSAQPAGVWAWTAGSMTYLRARPGIQTPPIAKVPRHTKLMVWGKFDGWYRVETPDHKFGWIRNELLNSPTLAKVQEMSHSKARRASNRTANQIMYGSAQELKKHYQRFGSTGAQKGLAALGVKVGPTKAQRLAALKAAQQKIAFQKAQQAKVQQAKAEQAKYARLRYAKYEQQKASQQKAQQEKAAQLKWAAAKAAQQKQRAAQIRTAAYKAAQYKAAQANAAQAKAAQERALQAKWAAEKAAQQKIAQQKAQQAAQLKLAQEKAAQERAAQLKAASASVVAKPASTETMPVTHPQIAQPVAQPKMSPKPPAAIVRVAPAAKTPSGTPLQPVLPNSSRATTLLAPAIPLPPKNNAAKGNFHPPSISPDDLMKARQDHMKRSSSAPASETAPKATKTAFVPQVYYLASAVYAPSMAKGDSASHFLPTAYKRDSFPSASFEPRLSEMGPKPLFSPVERTFPILPVAKPAAKAVLAKNPTKAAPKTPAKTAAAQPSPNRGGSPRDYVRVAQADFGQGVANQALSYRGRPYIRGAASPSRGFDCSGLVYFLLRQRGYNPPRTAAGLASYGKAVPAGQLQPGDLVLFANTYKRGVSHVGIYMGNSNFVHAATSGTGVRVDSLASAYYCRKYWGARRVEVKG